jgi:predicted aldo/keto reductase-like oxidoreductase
MELNRRNFLRISGAGVAGTMMVGSVNTSAIIPESSRVIKPSKIIYRTLGRTGIKVPVISLGAMRTDNSGLMKAALDSGIIHFDTAQSYQQGRNEEMLGSFLKEYKRDNFTIATKVKVPRSETTKEAFLATIDESLKRLQVNYVDILYYHAVDKKEVVLNPEFIGLMEEAKKSGKVKFIGVSVHRNMAEVINACVEAKIYDVVLTSYNVKMADQPEMTDALIAGGKAGIGFIAMKTMMGGYWDKQRTKKVNAKAALKWVLQNENIHTTIPGITSFEQLEESLSVMEDLTLTEKEREDLKGDGTTAGLFCIGCEQCVAQCPNHVPIPDIMRSYMYAYGYRDLKHAREVMDNLSGTDKSCSFCSTCNVVCRQGFDIQNKAKDIWRIQDIPDEFLV